MAGVRFHRQSYRGVRRHRLVGEKRWRLDMEENRKGKVSRARERAAPGHSPKGLGAGQMDATGETRFQMGGQSATAGRSDGFSRQRRCGARRAVQVSLCVAVSRWNDEWRMTNDERGPNEEVRAQLTWPRTRRRKQPPPGQQRRQQPRLARGLVPCSDELWVRPDVTVPGGHGMMGGAWLSKKIADPLEAHGLVLLGHEQPIVLAAVDWCEIRNETYARWQEALAAAAGTIPERVMICTVHQHDAPVADLEAERILRERNLAGT